MKFKNLSIKAVSFLGVAVVGVLASIPAFAQQSPNNPNSAGTSMSSPSSSGSSDSNSTSNQSEPVGTADHKDPASHNMNTERVEGSGNGNQSSSYGSSSAQQGVTSGGQYNNQGYYRGM